VTEAIQLEDGGMAEPQTPEWYEQIDEDVVDPAQRIIDPHHHLWPTGGRLPYGFDELTSPADTASSTRCSWSVARVIAVTDHRS
jgi:hypothetical protein